MFLVFIQYTLDVSHNPIGDGGLAHFGDLIESSSSLRVLNIGGIGIERVGFEGVAKWIEMPGTQLEALVLEGNRSCNRKDRVLANPLRKNTRLQILDLFGTKPNMKSLQDERACTLLGVINNHESLAGIINSNHTLYSIGNFKSYAHCAGDPKEGLIESPQKILGWGDLQEKFPWADQEIDDDCSWTNHETLACTIVEKMFLNRMNDESIRGYGKAQHTKILGKKF